MGPLCISKWKLTLFWQMTCWDYIGLSNKQSSHSIIQMTDETMWLHMRKINTQTLVVHSENFLLYTVCLMLLNTLWHLEAKLGSPCASGDVVLNNVIWNCLKLLVSLYPLHLKNCDAVHESVLSVLCFSTSKSAQSQSMQFYQKLTDNLTMFIYCFLCTSIF